ncbi:hypothetical protein BCV72DRAFT_142284, partial [Rhizopus microsporus var. microsporus]
VEKTSAIKTSLANICRYLKFVTLVQEIVDHITQLIYTRSIFAKYYFLVTQNFFYNIFSIFAGQGKHTPDSIKRSFKAFCESTSLTQSGSKRREHSVLKCESCGTVWNRDMNNTLNIYGIFVYKSNHDSESPPSFKRLTVLLDLMRCP